MEKEKNGSGEKKERGKEKAKKEGGGRSREAARLPLELYIHVPFCVKKCLYCDFLSFPAPEETRLRYVEKLIEEIRACGKRPGMEKRSVTTIFFGGGTPSLLPGEEMIRLLEAVRSSFHVEERAEITAEANPGTLDGKRLRDWRRAGINRLSLGLQSACDRELKSLGRIHCYGDFLESFSGAREAGFDNINIDLMAALPGQTVESYRDTLEKAARLSPEHISAYSLIIEEGTPFYELYGQMEAELERYGELSEIPGSRRSASPGLPPLPGESADREMYHFTKAYLREMGYERYEISNYARPGFVCRHNEGYWTGADYLGLGLGSASLFEGERFSVTRSMEEYLEKTEEQLGAGGQYAERHRLSLQERMEEFMFLGLRLTAGVSGQEFARRFGRSLTEVYGDACFRMCGEGLLVWEEDGERRLRLTERGLDVSNYVLAAFLL